MQYVEIKCLDGITKTGFLTTYKNLPKTSKNVDYFYDENFNMYSLYATSGKKRKYYIVKSNFNY